MGRRPKMIGAYSSDEPLTEAGEEFCEAYVAMCRDADAAFDIAGYKASTPSSRRMNIWRLMHNPRIKNRIDELSAIRNKRGNDGIVDRLWVVEKLKRIVNKEDDRPQYQLKALEIIAKSLGMLTDVQEVNINDASNPADIAKEVFKKRQQINAVSNILEFKTKEIGGEVSTDGTPNAVSVS